MDNASKISKAHQCIKATLSSKVGQGTGRIHAQETGWRSVLRLCIMPRLPTHLVQTLGADTVLVRRGLTFNYIKNCTTVACLPPIRGLEKCRVIGHNPHFSSLCSLSCLNPKVLPKGILFSACDWWKAVNCGTSHIDSSEAVVYGIPSGLLGSAS